MLYVDSISVLIDSSSTSNDNNFLTLEIISLAKDVSYKESDPLEILARSLTICNTSGYLALWISHKWSANAC